MRSALTTGRLAAAGQARADFPNVRTRWRGWACVTGNTPARPRLGRGTLGVSLGAPWQGLGVVVCALTVLAGCGYSVGYRAPPGVRTIAVPIFHNATFGLRREIEYGLTQLVRREIQSRTALRLVGSDRADVVLRGTIVDFREDLVVEGRRDRKVESTIRAVVDVKLEDHVNGYSLTRRVQDQQPFSPAFGETFEETQTRALENLAERIVAAVEYWDDYESAAAPAQPAEG